MKFEDYKHIINITPYREELGYYKCTAQIDPDFLNDKTNIKPNKKGICSYCLQNYSGLPSSALSIEKTGLCSDCSLYENKNIKRDYIYFTVEMSLDDILERILIKKEKKYNNYVTRTLAKEIMKLRGKK